MKELTVRDITKEYIRLNFDLNENRKNIKEPKYLGAFSFNEFVGSGKKIKPQEFFDFFRKKFSNVDLIEIDTYYESTDIDMYRYAFELETDDAVVTRLQKEQKLIIQVKNKELKQRTEYERLKEIYEG